MSARTESRLDAYRAKRDFGKTSEPGLQALAAPSSGVGGSVFVIQKHAASRLHYDLRLELDGVLLSWAMPRGPSFDPLQKRMAVRTEDHPLDYAGFEGTIPPKQYGAGVMIVWDRGQWEPTVDPHLGLEAGKLIFRLHGEKLAGLWELVRIQKPGAKQEPWMMFKKRDAWARPLADYDVITALPDSVIVRPLGLVEERERRDTLKQSLAPAEAIPTAQILAAAPAAALPDKLSPQLATLASNPPTTGDWGYEIKFDGYRILARIEHGQCRLVTRNGHDWTDKMQGLATAIEALGIRSAWLDGEAVVMGADGLPSFNALQNAFDRFGTEAIRLFLFDVPYLNGKDLRSLGLRQRRWVLREQLEANRSDRIRFSEEFVAPGANVLESACKMGLEGVIAKRQDAPYVFERSDTWLKLKCHRRQEFVIGGFTDRANSSDQVGSLLLGVYDDAGRLRSVGSVGTGWDSEAGAALWRTLVALEQGTSPFDAAHAPTKGRWSKRTAGSERWVRPELVAEVAFAEWTPDASIRHASFEGLRSDKDPKTIRRETALGTATATIALPTSKRRAPAQVASPTKVTNPGRVIDPGTGLTKLDLVRYYESVADFILPHLKSRPCSLVRGPTGVGGELFFQKHSERTTIPGLKDMDASLWPGHDALLEVPTAAALAGAAQMNVIEFHTWNSTSRAIDKPDRVIFDLDPGEGTSWQEIQEAALLVRGLLTELELEAWLKTSGGKGLHVVVPLTPKYDYDTVNRFSRAVVEHLARVIPSRFVAKSGAANRVGKLFVDYLRNGHGATTAAAFSARARPGLGVSMPVDWEALGSLKGGAQWTIQTAREHLSFQTVDPWAGYWKTKQTPAKAMRILG